MKVLLIGSGGREHAIAWKLSQSSSRPQIWASPGNGGILQIAQSAPALPDDWNAWVEFVGAQKIDLTMVGPEAPLVGGIADAFRKAGLKIVGPSAAAAQLEGSKIFAKQFMRRHKIPTADFEVFEDFNAAAAFAEKNSDRFGVIKADGLCAGKGVVVAEHATEAREALRQMLEQKVFGAAGGKVLIEEKLSGPELSVLAFCDGESLQTFVGARDYKRAQDRNQGPNTGGMGAMAPVAVSPELQKQIERDVCRPFLEGVQKENFDFRGVIYFGLMLTENGPKVLEFNVRFGDPETQVVLPLLTTDLTEAFAALAERALKKITLRFSAESAVGVVIAAPGYPGPYEKNLAITGLPSTTDELWQKQKTLVFHAGTEKKAGGFATTGGRVLNVVTVAESVAAARAKVYETVSRIHFKGAHFRRDIAQ